METKVTQARMLNLGRRLGLKFDIAVDCKGKSGGLALLWKEEVEVNIRSYSEGHIDAMIRDENEGEAWGFTGFYGNPKQEERMNSWTLMKRLSHGRTGQWICTGDFNELMFQHEKQGGLERSQRQMQEFREAVEYVELHDLGFEGPAFTWCNGRKDKECVWERLDRTLANPTWKNTFPNTVVTHEMALHSDHYPLFLTQERGENSSQPVKRKGRSFRFETF